MNILIGFLTAIHILVAVFIIILVLMQKSRDQGVGAAFGSGVTETVFGAGTTTALVRLTIYCALGLLATTLLLAVLYSRRTHTVNSLTEKVIGQPPARSGGSPGVSQPPALPVTEPKADLTVPAPAPTTEPPSTPAAPATPAPPAAPPAEKTP